MEKQIKILVRGGNVQHIESNFDCMVQIIDMDEEIAPKQPISPDVINNENKFIFEPHIEDGCKVRYCQNLSGFNNDIVLTVKKVWFEETNDLESALGVNEPKYLCSFIELPNLVSNIRDVELV